MSVPAAQRVLIVGSGIAGQTLACALARRGIACELIELRGAFDIIGAGMYMQATALRAFEDIGIVDEVIAAGWPIWDDYTIIATVNGEFIAQSQHRRMAGPTRPIMVPIQRRALHDVLASNVVRAGVRVRMGVTVERLDDQGSHVMAHLTDGTREQFDLVIGADGIRSRVRELLFPEILPRYSGFSNWRVILPRPPELTHPTWMIGAGGKSFGMVPLSAEVLYIAGVSKEPGNPRFERDDLPRLCRERFAQFGGIGGALLAQVTRPEQVVYTPIEEVEMTPPWHRGRVAILGDAAHATTPFWAQGAAMAIEDAVLLARYLETDMALDALLEAWALRRYDRCSFVQKGSAAAGAGRHNESGETLEDRYAQIRVHGQADMDRRLAKLAEEF